jgi:D-amino-acid dehydrogenase
MKVCVLGAGVIGLTTAWRLQEAGHDVVVLDQAATPGAGASQANGSQLSYSYVAPFASLEILRKLPGIALGLDPAIRLRPPLDFDFIRWTARFLACCTPKMLAATTHAQQGLAQSSRRELRRLTQGLSLDYDLRDSGKLVLFRRKASFDAARRQVALQSRDGCEQHILSAKECAELEPALRIAAGGIVGGVFTPSEQTGDCLKFCQQIAEKISLRDPSAMRLGVAIIGPRVENRALQSVMTDSGAITADLFVLAMGSASASFARKANIKLPIVPMKGYSLTMDANPSAAPSTHSVTYADDKIVFAPARAGNKEAVRVAGIADFVGLDTSLDPVRLSVIESFARDVLDAPHEAKTRPWAGLRPSTPDSRPIIGWSRVERLFLNTGHGGLGWTLACGSAKLATDLICGSAPDVDPRLFALDRFT